MKVAFIIPTLSAGGAERVVVRLANYLSDRSVEVFIFVSSLVVETYPLAETVQVRLLENLRSEAILKEAMLCKVDVISDHFHWSLDHLREISRVSKKIPVVLSEHNSFFYPLFQYSAEQRTDSFSLFQQRAELYSGFAAVTTLTRYSAGLLSVINPKTVLMYNPVSYDGATATDWNQRRIVTVSSFLKPAKRLDLLIAVMARLIQMGPPVNLRIVGESDASRFDMLRREHSIPSSLIELSGLSEDVSEHYLRSSIFAMTSEIEGQPMALLEAACHCLPQVVFAIPGIEDQVLDGETGYIVPFGNIDQFASKLNSLVQDVDLRRRMGLRSRDFVLERFGLEKVGARWLSLLETVKAEKEIDGRFVFEAKGEFNPSRMMADMNYWMGKCISPSIEPKVTIIVPVYGTESYLSRCLDSLIHQTFTQIEIIVVSDASPGNVEEIVKEYIEKDGRVSLLVHEQNRGLYQARSSGAKVARGAYLAHVDSDDYVHPEFIRRMYEAAVVRGADIVECGAVELSLNGNRREIRSQVDETLTQPRLFDVFAKNDISHVVWNKLYRTSFWKRANLHNNIAREFSIMEDLLRNTPLFREARVYARVNAILYFYVRREASVVTEGGFSKMLSKLGDILYVYNQVIHYLRLNASPDSAIQDFMSRQISDLTWYMGHGYSAARSQALTIQETADAHGIFAAVALISIENAKNLRQTEDKYWHLAKTMDALNAELAQVRENLEVSEAARLWEKERADLAEGNSIALQESDIL